MSLFKLKSWARKSMEQCTTLVAKVDMKIGRTKIKAGQRFWVTNCETHQQSSGTIIIDREGRGTMSHGLVLSEADINQYFERH